MIPALLDLTDDESDVSNLFFSNNTNDNSGGFKFEAQRA